jgi:hypothetical protein
VASKVIEEFMPYRDDEPTELIMKRVDDAAKLVFTRRNELCRRGWLVSVDVTCEHLGRSPIRVYCVLDDREGFTPILD